ncbi:MAG: DUF45 domain-containing protein [Coriobacteriales bacterium]|jgi:hypothetical protein|nr:DUF45 domain-containing protein [Coriobacteriales bacterium]
MDSGQIEVIGFPGIDVPVRRDPTQEIYLALLPPDAQPYVVAPLDLPIGEIAAFVQPRLELLKELRSEMLKHFSKTKSLRCHFRTGDIAHLLGRPFMLRVNPLSSGKKTTRGTRSRANVSATMHHDISVINLYVAQVGNFDQGRAAFMSYARPVFSHNIQSLLKQCMERVFPQAALPSQVNCRPMRDAWIRFDDERGIVWFSDSLIPYPAHAVVYAFLVEAIKRYAPDISDDERQALLTQGVINWQEMRDLLADKNNRFAL